MAETKRVLLSVPNEVYKNIETHRWAMHMTKTAFILRAILFYLEHLNAKKSA